MRQPTLAAGEQQQEQEQRRQCSLLLSLLCRHCCYQPPRPGLPTVPCPAAALLLPRCLQVVFDEGWDLLGFVGYSQPLDGIVVAFRGTDSHSIYNWWVLVGGWLGG